MGSTAANFTAVDLTLAGSRAITIAGSTTIASATADTLVDFTRIRGGVITAPIRPDIIPT
jgi:hypothetical protein